MTFGLVEIGLCGRCTSPDFLFVHSSAASSKTYCVPCISRILDIDRELDPYPTEDDFPIMALTSMCQGCNRPEFGDGRWQLKSARLADHTEIMVHTHCVFDSPCSDCGFSMAISSRRPWSMAESGVDIPLSAFSDLLRVNGSWRCNMCLESYYKLHGGERNFTYCEHCEDTVHNDSTGVFRGDTYCNRCISNNVFECDECGSERWDSDDHECEDYNDSRNLIHSYGYKPNPIFFGTGTYHMGFELEVENRRSSSRLEGAQLAQDTLDNHAYMKSDASLEDGFEIVTHPHTLAYYQQDFEWEVLSKLRRNGFRSWDTTTCGLHVHVSRTAFGGMVDYSTSASEILRMQAHQLRFMKLIYDNERQVSRIAGRSSSSYASFSDKGRLIPKVKQGYSERGHFSAVNVENYATLEIRVFKGSLRKERILSALEFVSASVEYTRNLKVTGNNTALSWLRFTAYVSQEATTYPNLALIMSESFTREQDPSDNDN